jgi:hypothetical protein
MFHSYFINGRAFSPFCDRNIPLHINRPIKKHNLSQNYNMKRNKINGRFDKSLYFLSFYASYTSFDSFNLEILLLLLLILLLYRLCSPGCLGLLHGFVTVHLPGVESLAPRPISNLKEQGLHCFCPLLFYLPGMAGSTRSLLSHQHSSRGHRVAQTSSSP